MTRPTGPSGQTRDSSPPAVAPHRPVKWPVMVVWFWLINLALPFGIECDAEVERKELEDGVPRADREIQLDALDEHERKQTI